jgi:tetratricopeptide (TPR) repeat protein
METLLPNKGYLLSEAKPALSGVVTVRELREVHSRIGQQNYYDRLGVPMDQRDNVRAIRVAYHTLTRRYDRENMTERTNEVRRLLRDVYNALGKAYEVLTDTDTRNKYNFKLAADAEAALRAETEVLNQAEALAALEEKQAVETAAAKAKEDASAPAWNLPQGDPPVVVNEEAPAPPAQNETPAPPTQNETPAPPSQKNDPMSDGMQEFWDKRGVGEHEPHEKLSTAAHLQAIMGDYEGAVELYEQCVKLQPENDEYLFKLELARGRMFKKNGNKLRAQKYFETAQAIAPVGNNSAQEELDELVQTGKKTGGGLKNLLFSKKK